MICYLVLISQPGVHIDTNNSKVVQYVYIQANIYVTIMVKEHEAIDLRRSRGWGENRK